MGVHRMGENIYATLHHAQYPPDYLDAVCVWAAPTIGYAALDLPVGEYRLHVVGPQRAGRYDVSVRADRIVTTPRDLEEPMRHHDPVSLRIEDGTVRIHCDTKFTSSTPEHCGAFVDDVVAALGATRLPDLGEGRQPFTRFLPADETLYFLRVSDHDALKSQWNDIMQLATTHEVRGMLYTWMGGVGNFH